MKITPVSGLAFAATTVAICLSIIAGWQRGGFLAERVLIIGAAAVIVVATHLLPALCRRQSLLVQTIGATLWIGCIAATCYGHTAFFLMAQRHAGDARAAVVPMVSFSGRNLSQIASERADIEVRLARAVEFRCRISCAANRVERTALNARLRALDVEAAEVTQRQLEIERADADRTSARADPVAGLATNFSIAAGTIDFAIGMTSAMLIEGVACFCWLLVLPISKTACNERMRDSSHVVTALRVTPAAGYAGTNPESVARLGGKTAPSESWRADELNRVLTAIGHGTIRGTVVEIRRFLGCSQAKAAALRKHVAQRVQVGHMTSAQLF